MDTKSYDMAKRGDEHVEHIEQHDEPLKQTTEYDRFGSAKKTDPKEIKLVRKIDIYMMVSSLSIQITQVDETDLAQPILWLMYFLNFLDRNAMVNGKLNSLSEDLNLEGTQYNTCVSILFVG